MRTQHKKRTKVADMTDAEFHRYQHRVTIRFIILGAIAGYIAYYCFS